MRRCAAGAADKCFAQQNLAAGRTRGIAAKRQGKAAWAVHSARGCQNNGAPARLRRVGYRAQTRKLELENAQMEQRTTEGESL